MFGDSNSFDHPPSCLTKFLGRYWVHKSTADMVHDALLGRVIQVSSSYLQVSSSCKRYLTTTLETILLLNPDIEVHVLVLSGQTDADNASRSSTRNSQDIRDEFRAFVKWSIQDMTTTMAVFPQVVIHWIEPFDDSSAVFTPLYDNLVDDLKEIVRNQDHMVKFGPFVSFEADHYHLSESERQTIATQILDWFAGPIPCGQRSVPDVWWKFSAR